MQILHILRAPVGGLFRHVCDLVQVQAELGHDVAIVCDSEGGGERTRQALSDLEQYCRLGIFRIAMPRLPGPSDVRALRDIGKIVDTTTPQILHGHGAKGGLYGRLLAGRSGAKTIYTPHGGALHYSWTTPQGAVFLGAERMLLRKTAGLSFVCRFEKDAFEQKIGLRGVRASIVHNGLWPHEFEPVVALSDATDLLFVGELRVLKGVDVLIDAVGLINQSRPLTLTIVGDGPDRRLFEQQVERSNLSERVRFTGALPARTAFTMGRIIVIPSRAESFPYIVLEAIAAGIPIIATRVGGIPEILPKDVLVAPGDAGQLASAIQFRLDDIVDLGDAAKAEAQTAAGHLGVHEMGRKIVGFYEDVLSNSAGNMADQISSHFD